MEIAAWEVLLIGSLIVLSLLSKAALEHFNLPDLLGYLLIGVGLQTLQQVWPAVLPNGNALLTVLANVGIVALLFRIGLECELEHLLGRLPGATRIWLVNVILSLGAVLGTTLLVLDWAFLPSLFVAVALMATGIGVSVRVWRQSDQIGSAKGALLLDVAELDDLLGIVLLAVLTALVPHLQGDWSAALFMRTLWTLGETLGKMGGLLFGGLLFGRYLETSLTHWMNALLPRADMMISVLGVGLVLAGLTALLGFSAAIGGFFAGLLFSEDPLAVKVDASFDSVHDLFVPFFFIHIGFLLDLGLLASTIGSVLLLLVASILGKGVGSFLPIAERMRLPSALIFTVALLPRSEITLIVMRRGLELGVVPSETFGIVVTVVAFTMVGVPLALRGLPPK